MLNNYVHHNKGPGLWADTNNTGFLISGNYIDRNEGEGLIYETSYNASIVNNTFSRNAWKSGLDDGGFPIPAVYLSESGSDPRAGATYGETLDIIGNRFIDNWSGVVGWENADRFAGSPNNSSTGETTLVNPSVATVDACSDPDLIGTSPYFDDCRWKVQHLRVSGNLFKIRPDPDPELHGGLPLRLQRTLRQLRFGPRMVALQGVGGHGRHHVRAGQPVVPQSLRRTLALPDLPVGRQGLLEHLAFVEVRSGRGQHPQVRQGLGPGHPVHDRRVLEERDIAPTAGA